MRNLEDEVKELSDIEKIRSLLSEYAWALDTKNLEKLLSLYEEDAKYQVDPPLSFKTDGKAELRKTFEQYFLHRPFTSHHTMNIKVTLSGNEATLDSYFIAISITDGIGYETFGNYHFKLRKSTGSWKFYEQRVVFKSRVKREIYMALS